VVSAWRRSVSESDGSFVSGLSQWMRRSFSAPMSAARNPLLCVHM